jgi:hypothetical protein
MKTLQKHEEINFQVRWDWFSIASNTVLWFFAFCYRKFGYLVINLLLQAKTTFEIWQISLLHWVLSVSGICGASKLLNMFTPWNLLSVISQTGQNTIKFKYEMGIIFPKICNWSTNFLSDFGDLERPAVSIIFQH